VASFIEQVTALSYDANAGEPRSDRGTVCLHVCFVCEMNLAHQSLVIYYNRRLVWLPCNHSYRCTEPVDSPDLSIVVDIGEQDMHINLEECDSKMIDVGTASEVHGPSCDCNNVTYAPTAPRLN
jgi:hypothetical protein